MIKVPFFDCRACVERGSELLDGELPLVTRFVTSVHVRFCKDCRAHTEQLRQTIEIVRAAQGERRDGLGEDAKRALLEKLGRR